MVDSKTLCRISLETYSTFMVTLTAVYLWSQCGVRHSFVEVREETQEHNDGVVFTESGGAEYMLVVLSHILHLSCLALFLFGYKSGVKMTVGCALLLTCGLMYILFYGCMGLTGLLEQQRSFSPDAAAGHQRKQKPLTYPAEVEYTDSATAVSGAAASDFNGVRREVSRAAAKEGSSEPGTCGTVSAHAGKSLSYEDLGWAVLRTLAGVLAAIAGSFDSPAGDAGVRLHPNGPLTPFEAPFAGVRRLDLLVLSCAGFALSSWGVVLFGASTAPASARSQRVIAGSGGRGNRDSSPRAAGQRASAATALKGSESGAAHPSAAAGGVKKNQ
ncbi:hypothetical protein MNV84_04424 [Leishmania braziliensis]|nr:hypothetical protein MNV84_04424 [Leishmania braziliensis]